MNVAGYHFSEPVPLGDGFDCPCAGVYLILCPTNGPGDVRDDDGIEYVVGYVGQSKDVGERVDSGHERWDCFHDECPAPYIAFHRMDGSSAKERRRVEAELIKQFQPACNR